MLVLFSGWHGADSIRLDMIGIIGLDAATLAAATVLLATQIVESWRTSGRAAAVRVRRARLVQRAYTDVLIGFHVAAGTLVAVVYLVQLFPPLLLVLAAWLEGLRRIDVSAALWSGLDPDRCRDDVGLLVNRLVLAALSYLPFAIVRFAYHARQVSRLKRSLGELQVGVRALEQAAPLTFDESD